MREKLDKTLNEKYNLAKCIDETGNDGEE